MLTPLLVLCMTFSFAQEKTISGNVTDQNGLPLPGVSIVVVGTSTGTQTDFDGNYSINANVGQVLRYSYIGQTTVNMTVGSANSINVQMQEDAQALEEVVVQGYRTASKAKSSIASVTVTAETIKDKPNASFVQALQGQVAGLNIVSNTGQPGAESAIFIRGVNSINGSTQPLFIIDGAYATSDNFRSLSPNDIASITTLKDAGATAQYGNRGANGVIIIKTKAGKFNQPLEIGYRGVIGSTRIQANDYNLADSQEMLRLERDRGTGVGNGLTDAEIAEFTTTEWLDVFFRRGLSQDHSVQLSSGSEKASQFTSLGFFDQQGILQESSLKRFSVRSNVTGRSDNDRFNYGVNISMNYSTSETPTSVGTGGVNQNFILGAFQSVPYLSPDDYTPGDGNLIAPIFRNTPLFLLDKLFIFDSVEEEFRMIGSFNSSYKITDNLTISNNFAGDFAEQKRLDAESSRGFTRQLFAQAGNTTPGQVRKQNTRSLSFNNTTSINWAKEFGKHTVDASAIFEYTKNHYDTFGFFARGTDPKTESPGDGSSFVGDNAANDFFVDDANANILSTGRASYLGILDYDYDTRYGFQGTIRRDGSSRFIGDNKWGTFFAVSARWNIINESFMENSGVDDLKLRASYGTNGNDIIFDQGGFLTNVSSPDLTEAFFATGAGYQGVNSIFRNQIAQPGLKFEEVSQLNVGLDFAFFNSRIRGSVDWYQKETKDLFQFTPVSNINGVTGLNRNFGSLENEGVDLTTTFDVIRKNKTNLTVRFVGNYNKSTVGETPSADGNIDAGFVSGGLFREYYTTRYVGVNPANGNLLFLDADGNTTENPDPDTDRVATGKNIFPELQGSFGFDFNHGGFFVNTTFTYTEGVDRFDNDYANFVDPTNIGQFRLSRDILRAWTPDNRVTDIPSLTLTNQAADTNSDRFLRSSDYIRLRNATIGYGFNEKQLKGTGFTGLRFYITGENVITWSEWRGYDAESTVNTSRRFPTPAIYSVGFELNF